MVDRQAEIAKRALEDHKMNTEKELKNGKATMKTWEAVEEKECELTNIKQRLNEEIARCEDEATRLVLAKEAKVRVMEVNKKLVDYMEEERDRILTELEQFE